MKHWGEFLPDKGSLVELKAKKLTEQKQRVFEAKLQLKKEECFFKELELDFISSISNEWDDHEINYAMSNASEFKEGLRSFRVKNEMLEALDVFLKKQDLVNGVISFPKNELRQFFKDEKNSNLNRILTSYCLKNKFEFMPHKRVQKEHNGKIEDFIEIKISNI